MILGDITIEWLKLIHTSTSTEMQKQHLPFFAIPGSITRNGEK